MDLPAEKVLGTFTDTYKTKCTRHLYVPKCHCQPHWHSPTLEPTASCMYSSPLPSRCNNFIAVTFSTDHFDAIYLTTNGWVSLQFNWPPSCKNSSWAAGWKYLMLATKANVLQKNKSLYIWEWGGGKTLWTSFEN